MAVLRPSVVVAVLAMLWSSPTALAAPPPNDARAAAQSLRLPASVRGTTVESTVETQELGSACEATKNSVWYAFTADTGRSIVIALDAGGDLDATIDVFERQRSQVSPLDCKDTNRNGAATIARAWADAVRPAFRRPLARDR